MVLFSFRSQIMHFSEAFFVHELPWKSLLNITESRYAVSISYYNLYTRINASSDEDESWWKHKQTKQLIIYDESYSLLKLNELFISLQWCSFQKHMSMGQCVKSSRYLAMIPPVTIECAEVDGDPTTTPIFFEDRYVNRTGKLWILKYTFRSF
jgi:hypothetical protein